MRTQLDELFWADTKHPTYVSLQDSGRRPQNQETEKLKRQKEKRIRLIKWAKAPCPAFYSQQQPTDLLYFLLGSICTLTAAGSTLESLCHDNSCQPHFKVSVSIFSLLIHKSPISSVKLLGKTYGPQLTDSIYFTADTNGRQAHNLEESFGDGVVLIVTLG